jgi:hypothetical protein
MTAASKAYPQKLARKMRQKPASNEPNVSVHSEFEVRLFITIYP